MNTNLHLKDLLNDQGIEDLSLSLRGLSYFKAGTWHGPFQIPECQPTPLQQLVRLFAEQVYVTMGPTRPSLDAYIELDGYNFRLHMVVPPMSYKGPEITLRRLPGLGRIPISSFRNYQAFEEKIKEAVHNKDSILICGNTGSGKSTLLTALMSFFSANERVIILEDSPELPMPNAHSLKLLARQDRFGFSQGAHWNLTDLLYESLRMRPDRIILGECRGPEASAILSALQTGHRGMLSTIHAGSPLQAIDRFYQLVNNHSSQKLNNPNYWDWVLHVQQKAEDRVISDFWKCPP